jgi:diguanylate cyclase (GGDEF)-like protein
MNATMYLSQKPEATAADILSYEQILDVLPHPILLVRFDGVIIYANQASQAVLEAVVGKDVYQLFPSFSPRIVTDADHSTHLLVSKDGRSFEATPEFVSDGIILLDLRLLLNGPVGTASRDRDELTGLMNRQALLSRMSRTLGQGGACRPIAVHCLDLDRFKMVNDTLGHVVGDLLLKKVAGRLQSACGGGDAIARIGGDEFVILQHDVTDEATAAKLASRIVDIVGRTYVIHSHTINIGVSVGVAIETEASQACNLLRNGELALSEAKTGRGRYCIFQPGMDTCLIQRREIEVDLRRAVALKQFKLNYQPFVDVLTNEVAGFEALLRWEHPAKGFIPPLTFIPVAEETGLITKIGDWVMRTACEEAVSWPGEVIVAVNVSPLQFRAHTLLQTVASALERSGLPAHRLEIEITEGALLDDTEKVVQTLNALRDLGVKISMDDFGTGYSSLSYLQKFPFDKIKIDRSFVAVDSEDSAAILKSIATLGNSLGMAITAEGVETAEQLARVRAERCTHVQGYLTGRPMGANQIPSFFTQHG